MTTPDRPSAPLSFLLSRAAIGLLAAALLLGLVLAGGLPAQRPGREAATTPADAVRRYLAAAYARDYARAWPLISRADRRLKSREDYLRENQAFRGATLELARGLAEHIRLDNVRTTVEGDLATVTFDMSLPAAQDPSVEELFREFDPDVLARLAPRERRGILEEIDRLAAAGALPRIVSRDERWQVVREDGQWRVLLDWADAVLVRFEGAAMAGLPWEFRPVQPVVRAKPGETLQTTYRVRNLGDREITAKARHVLDPPEETGHLQIVTCFCFLQQTLAPGEERELPVVFRVSYELPEAIRDLRVRYEYFPLDRFPWPER